MAKKGRFRLEYPSVLTCYPEQSYWSGGALRDSAEFGKVEYGQHEPISNFSYAEDMKIIYPIGQPSDLQSRESALSSKAVTSALNKFYKKGRWGYSNGSVIKDVYSPLIEWNRGTYYEGDCNRSNNINSDLIYCSRVPWYGYKVNGVDLNSDPENLYNNDAGQGYLITPDELEMTNWTWERTKQIWTVVGKDDCGNDKYGYKDATYHLYTATTYSYDWKKIPSGFTFIYNK